MANTDKDILITPNRGSADEPKIEFKGASSTVGPSTITATIYPTNNGTLSFDGTEGSLFSIANNLTTGSIFSVNPISGIPIIDVNADRTIALNPYGGNTGIGLTNPSYKLDVNGTARFSGQITVPGNNSILFGPNSTWSRYLRIGGNGWAADSTTASVVTTDGNLHLDAADANHGIYLNWYGGTNGTYFGNGAAGQIGRLDGSGNFSVSGTITGTQITSNIANGTAPLVVSSTTKVTNLNADYLDDQQGSYYLNYTNFTNTPTIGNGTITVQGTAGLTGSGSFTVNQTGITTVTLNHADTSTQASVDNSNGTVIQDVTLDEYGHVTGLASVDLDGRYYTESEINDKYHDFQWRWIRYGGYVSPAAGDNVSWTNYFRTYFLNRSSATESSHPTQDSGYISTYDVGTLGGFGGSNYGNIFGDLSSYHCHIYTHIYVEREFSINPTQFNGDDPHAIFINGVFVHGNTSCCVDTSYSYKFQPGWYRIDLIYSENSGGDYIQMGWNPKDYTTYIKDMTSYRAPSTIFSENTFSSLKPSNNQFQVNINSPASSNGSWTTATSDEWGNPKFDGTFNEYRFADAPAWVQYDIPVGMKSAWISQFCWSSGGYVDVHGVQSGGQLVFLRRINTRQTVENTDEGINHDGSTVTFAASGLDDYSAIRFTVQSGRFHLTGLSFSTADNEGTEGVGMVHPAQISHQGDNSGLDADKLDGQHGSYYLDTSNTTQTKSGNLKITALSESWAEGVSVSLTSSSAWGGYRLRREREGDDGNWAFGYTALDSTDDLVFISNNSGSQVNNILRLTKTAKVGVNNASPLEALDVRGNFLLAADSTTATHITQKPYTINGGTLSWEGSAGQLFSITNNLTSGSIFSVNDVSGIPSIDVDANGTILFAPYGGNIGVGTLTPSQKLHVVGNSIITGSLGLGIDSALAKLHTRVSTPTSIGSLPSGVTGILDSSSNNYLLFRNSADNGTYSGIAMQDNNVGGYVIFGNAGGGGDLLYVAGYGGGQLQYGTADSINPSARTTVASWNSTGLQINSGDLRAPIYRDSDDPTNRYLDPSGTTSINALNAYAKSHYFGTSTNWDEVGFDKQTNVHFQNHGKFWIGAGNGTWFTGAGNTRSQASGLAGDVTYAHDLLITTMQSDVNHDRGITFAVDNTGAGNSGWRLGKWHSGDDRDSSKFVVDGQIFAKAGYTDEYDYYADDYSSYYSSQGGYAHWGGDVNAGWHVPGVVTSSAIQIQSGNAGTNARKPQIQFHQYGYGGPAIEYDGPNKTLMIGELGSSTANRLSTVNFRMGGGTIYSNISTSYINHTVEMRAPIFKDSNDINYYADFANTGTSIVTAGNIGAKTTSPLQALDVRGNFLLAADATTATHITQKPYTVNGGTLSWEGSEGQLFSIANNLTTGSIFSVNPISGIPIIDVNADRTIALNPYGGNTGIGLTNPSYKLDVNGTTRFSGASIFSSNISLTNGYIRAITNNQPAILSVANGSASTGASFAIQQETAEGWTGIFVDYEPYTGWGLYHDNPNNYFCVTSESSTGNLRSFTVPSRVSGNRTAYEKIRFNQNDGSLIAGGTVTAPTFSGSLSGNASSATIVNGTSGQLGRKDDRIIEPNSITSGRLQFGFTSWANNNTSPYADYLHLRSYTDASGGSDNLVMFRKDTLGMRIWQQSWNSASAYSSYKDVCWTDGTNASGTWGISISGSAANLSGFTNSNSSNPVGADGVTNNGIAYVNSNIALYSQTDGALYSQAYSSNWIHQIYGDYRTGQIAIRGKNNGTWQSWRTVLDSSNWSSYVTAGATLSASSGSQRIVLNASPTETSGTLTSAATNSALTFNTTGGILSSTVFTSTSDITKKTNIQNITNAVELTKQINGVKFDWKETGESSAGVIAQEVEEVLPEIVHTNDGIKSVNYNGVVGLLVEAIKEQQKQIDELKKELKKLHK